jgi:hypothetical protein
MLLIVLSMQKNEKKVVIMRVVIILIAFLGATIFPVISKAPKLIYTGKENVSFVNTVETKHCFISYVLINEKTYLVKQKKDYDKQLAVVRDALAAYVAKTLRGIAHEIQVIGIQQQFSGKINQYWPATLHTIAKGETVRKQPQCKYNALRLRQFWAQAPSFAEQGLTKLIIEYMTWHQQLPSIIALDLFIGNSDRHCGNLCYDSATDKFCAIDMDDTFNKDLCKLACKKLKYMIKKEKVVFNKDEINALKHMRDTLKLLVHKHRPNEVIQQLRFFAQQAGFVEGSPLYDERIERKLSSYELMIIESYKSAYQLIDLLDKIVDVSFKIVDYS